MNADERYVAHEPLMNFMAPVPTTDWSEEMTRELFKTLFGGAKEPVFIEARQDDGFRIM
jgi:Apoptosis-antagonizing transcription factor, C-terminal